MKQKIVAFVLVVLMAACAPTVGLAPTPSPSSTAPVQPTPTARVDLPTTQPARQVVDLDVLRNFTYALDSSHPLPVTLVDGSFQTNGTGTAGVMSGQIVHAALGDLNGDGIQDAAVTLAVNLGGSGTFHELIVVLAQNGNALQAAHLFLEDRLAENKLSIEKGLITLDAVRHAPSDPLCCPTVHAVTVYRYQDGQLVVVSDQVQASQTAPGAPYPNRIALDSPQNGEVVGHTIHLRGTTTQIPFEKNLVVRGYTPQGSLVMEKALAVQGDYGGAGSFDTNLQLPADLKGSVRLEVVDIDMSNGQPRGLAAVVIEIQ